MMSPDEMLDYALGLLDEPRRDQIDRDIASDLALAGQLARLRRNLDALMDDGPGPEPPSGLARRTILLVEVRRRRRSILDLVPARVPFRWADVAVAAGIFLAGLLTLLPALQRSQYAARTAICADNLRQIGLGLIRYAATHNAYPYTPPDSAAPYAGAFASQLREAGLIQDGTVLDCPLNGRNTALPREIPDLDGLETIVRQQARTAPCLRDNDYAYTLGYCQGRDRACPLPASLPGDFPLLSDRPNCGESGQALGGNSLNHGGSGQNVFFAGGHVGFFPSPRIGTDPDIFHNSRGLTDPGDRPSDYVLAPAFRRISAGRD